MIQRILPGRVTLRGGNRGEGDRKPSSHETISTPHEEAPMPQIGQTRDFPSFIKIMNRANPLVFRANQSTRIELLSDAPNGFLARNHAFFSLGDEANKYVAISYFQKDFTYGSMFIGTIVRDKAPVFTKFDFEIRLNAMTNSAEKVVLRDNRSALIDEPILKKETRSDIQSDAPYIIVVDRSHPYYMNNQWTELHVAEVEKMPEKTVIYVSVENQWYHGMLRKSRYSEVMKRTIQNRYVLLIAFNAFLQDDFIERLPTDIDKQNYEKLKQGQLEIAARTILTGLTTERAFNSNQMD
jgi:hypothetical protein